MNKICKVKNVSHLVERTVDNGQRTLKVLQVHLESADGDFVADAFNDMADYINRTQFVQGQVVQVYCTFAAKERKTQSGDTFYSNTIRIERIMSF